MARPPVGLDPAAGRTRVSWVQRRVPLVVQGVIGHGAVARQLAAGALARPEGLSGVATRDTIVLLGDVPPWADGAVFIGAEPGVPGLWSPTAQVSDVHPGLVLAAVRRRGVSGPVVVAPLSADRVQVVSLADARPVDVGALTRWLV